MAVVDPENSQQVMEFLFTQLKFLKCWFFLFAMLYLFFTFMSTWSPWDYYKPFAEMKHKKKFEYLAFYPSYVHAFLTFYCAAQAIFFTCRDKEGQFTVFFHDDEKCFKAFNRYHVFAIHILVSYFTFDCLVAILLVRKFDLPAL